MSSPVRTMWQRSLAAGLALLALAPSAAWAQASPSAYTSGTRYDAMHRVVGTIAPDPDGSGPIHYAAVRTTYDIAGRVTKVEKGELSAWQAETIAPSAWTGFTVFQTVDTTYDGMSRKLTDTLSSGGTAYTLTQYSYDAVGRLQCTAVRMNPAAFGSLPASACTLGTAGSAGADRITRNVYDNVGQLLKVQKAYGTPRQQDYATYTYSANGKQTSVTDADGNTAAMTYDGRDTEIAWTFPSKTTPGTAAPCMIGTVTETGGVTSPSETRTTGDDCEKYAYDLNGNRATLMKRDGQIIRYSYDALNRMTFKDVPGGTTADVYYDYDVWGRELYARFGSATGSGITNVYDGFGRLTSTADNMDGTARTLSYQYDADDNRTQITHPDGNYFTYLYDGLDRPTSIKQNGSGQVAAFAYDAQGHRASDARGAITQAYGYDAVSRLASLGHDLGGTANDVSWAFGYNPASQIASVARTNDLYAYAYVATNKSYAVNGLNQYTSAAGATLAYDDNGNLTSDGTTTYGYDAENRLVSASSGVTLAYDPMGRLWKVTGPSTLTEFYYDGDALVEERDASGALLRRYVHGMQEDDPLLWYEGSGLTDRRGLAVDHQGSILSITDASGTAITLNAYDEYGVPAANNLGRFQYTGQAWIPELGVYYYKARMYSSRLGRFLQTDPIGYKDQVNLYAYVGNDPVDGVDPSGECTGDTPAICEMHGAIFAGGQHAIPLPGVHGTQCNTCHTNSAASDLSTPSTSSVEEVVVIARSIGHAIGAAVTTAAKGEPRIVGHFPLATVLSWVLKSSPHINPGDLIGKNPDELDNAARGYGLIPKGPNPKGGKGAYVDPVTGKQRVLVHGDDGHFHVNNPDGERLDEDGNVVAPESPEAHLPIGP